MVQPIDITGPAGLPEASAAAAQVGARRHDAQQQQLAREHQKEQADKDRAYDMLARSMGYQHNESMQNRSFINQKQLEEDAHRRTKELIEYRNRLQTEMNDALMNRQSDLLWSIRNQHLEKQREESRKEFIYRSLFPGPVGNPQRGASQAALGVDISAAPNAMGIAPVPYGGDPSMLQQGLMDQMQANVSQQVSAITQRKNAMALSTSVMNEAATTMMMREFMVGDAFEQSMGSTGPYARMFFQGWGDHFASWFKGEQSTVGGQVSPLGLDRPSKGMEDAGVGLRGMLYNLDQAMGGEEGLFGIEQPVDTSFVNPEIMGHRRFTEYVGQGRLDGGMIDVISRYARKTAPNEEQADIYEEEARALFDEILSVLPRPGQSKEAHRRILMGGLDEQGNQQLGAMDNYQKVTNYIMSEEGDPVRAEARLAALSTLGNFFYGLSADLTNNQELMARLSGQSIDPETGQVVFKKISEEESVYWETIRKRLRELSEVGNIWTSSYYISPEDKNRVAEIYNDSLMTMTTPTDAHWEGPMHAGDPVGAVENYISANDEFKGLIVQNNGYSHLTDDEAELLQEMHTGPFTEEEIESEVLEWVNRMVDDMPNWMEGDIPNMIPPNPRMIDTSYGGQLMRVARLAVQTRFELNYMAPSAVEEADRKAFNQD